MPKLLLVMVLTLLVAAPAAMAGTRADIVKDCFRDGDLDGNYTASQIRDEGGDEPVQVGDGTVVPGASGFSAGAARSDIPSTLLTALILLGVAALAAAAPYARRTVVPFVRQRVLRRRLA